MDSLYKLETSQLIYYDPINIYRMNTFLAGLGYLNTASCGYTLGLDSLITFLDIFYSSSCNLNLLNGFLTLSYVLKGAFSPMALI